MKNVWLISKQTLKNLFLHFTTYLILGSWLILTSFMLFILPTILPSPITITTWYNQPAWLTTTYPATLIFITLLSALISENTANKNKMLYLVTKRFSRGQYLWSQFLSVLIIVFPCVLLTFLSFVIINLHLTQTDNGSLFVSGVHWYGLLISLLIGMFLGTSVITWHLHIKTGISTLAIVLLISIFLFVYPMVWYVDSTDDSIVDPHRLYFTFLGPLIIYMPLTILLWGSGVIIFLKKRINA